MSWLSRLQSARSSRGAAVVEFALVVPILLLLVFGIIQYGLYFWALQGGADATRHAARISAVGNPTDCDDFRAEVARGVARFSENTPKISRSYANAEGNSSPDVEVGDRVRVTVVFNSYDLDFPFVPFIEDGTVSETAEARVDYVPAQPEPCP